MSAKQIADAETPTFFRDLFRPTCSHVHHTREIRQQDGRFECVLCSAPLIPVRRDRRAA